MTLHEQLEDIFRDVLADPTLSLSDGTTAGDLPGWDSVAHINTMFSIEETFGVEFHGEEFARLETIGHLKQALLGKGVQG